MVQNGFTVYGMDNSPQAIQSAQEWLQAEGLTADLKYGDITEPFPYPDAFFDGLISVQVINHGDNATVKRIADEITRVLKPGGVLFITVATLKTRPRPGNRLNRIPSCRWTAGKKACSITFSHQKNCRHCSAVLKLKTHIWIRSALLSDRREKMTGCSKSRQNSG